MPIHEISLNGEWRLTGIDSTGDKRPVHISATVPGQVQMDLEREGLIPKPFWRDNADQLRWIEAWDWRYERVFDIADDIELSWVLLEFLGLDTHAEIRLNDELLSSTDNMFIPHRFDVSHNIKHGTNRLEVLFPSFTSLLKDKPVGKYRCCFNEERVFFRKMQCGFGWDWVHRFVTCGIWRPVRLTTYTHARIDDIFVETRDLHEDMAVIGVQLRVRIPDKKAVTAVVVIRDPSGISTLHRTVEIEEPGKDMEFQLKYPRLWWPNGMGGQPLYTCEVTLLCEDHIPVDQRTVCFGLRTVEVEEIPHDTGKTFTIKINGEPVFCKGGNWVPADPFPASIDATRYERLISLARDSNCNMLRAWGGGIYEPEPFWDACNRMGIMVIQDFLLACADYPEEDPTFMDALRKEFREAILMLRNHPSLVLWSGNNELGMNSAPNTNFSGKRIGLEISEPLCTELDPTRPYRLTSPYGGKINNAPEIGDSHISSWYSPKYVRTEMQDYRERIADLSGSFLSESAIPGAPPMRSLLKFMSPEDIVDPEGLMWEYHTKDNLYKGDTTITHYRMLENTAEALYGPTDDPQSKVRHMEYVQYEWIRAQIEGLRRRAYRCSGVLFWMYNDCWPASGWSVIDYFCFPKAGYYAMRQAFKQVIVALEPKKDRVGVWLCNDGRKTIHGKISAQFQPWNKEAVLLRQDDIDAHRLSVVHVGDISHREIGHDGVLLCEFEGEGHQYRATFFLGMPYEMALPTALLRTHVTHDGGHGTVEISSHCYARVVTLEADLDFSDNYFDLLPGETRTIEWSDPFGVFNNDIHVTCWNGSR